MWIHKWGQVTLGVQMKSGRYLRENGPVEEVVVNQELVDHFGWDSPIGRTFPFEVGQIETPIVVGVIEAFDFNT